MENQNYNEIKINWNESDMKKAHKSQKKKAKEKQK